MRRDINLDNVSENGYVVAKEGRIELVLTKAGLVIRVDGGADLSIASLNEMLELASLWKDGHNPKHS